MAQCCVDQPPDALQKFQHVMLFLLLVSLTFICISCKWRSFWIKINIISVLKNTNTDLRIKWNLCLSLIWSTCSEQQIHSHILNLPVRISCHDLGSETEDGNLQRKVPLVPVRMKTWMIWLQFCEVLFEIYSWTFQSQANFLIFILPLAEFCCSERWGGFSVSRNNFAFTIII